MNDDEGVLEKHVEMLLGHHEVVEAMKREMAESGIPGGLRDFARLPRRSALTERKAPHRFSLLAPGQNPSVITEKLRLTEHWEKNALRRASYAAATFSCVPGSPYEV